MAMGYEDCECDGYKKAYAEELSIAKVEFDKKTEKIRQQILEDAIWESGLGARFATRTLDTFIAETEWQKKALEAARQVAKAIVEGKHGGNGLLLSGSVGTGKTHLAAGIAIVVMSERIPVVFGTSSQLLGKIREGWKSDSDTDYVQRLCNAPLLVIDDIGKEYSRKQDGWSWAQEQFFMVINSRYEGRLPTVITTNLDIDGLMQSLGEATVSRLIESCRGVRCDGEDYRMRR